MAFKISFERIFTKYCFLSELKGINQLLLPLKPSENHSFYDFAPIRLISKLKLGDNPELNPEKPSLLKFSMFWKFYVISFSPVEFAIFLVFVYVLNVTKCFEFKKFIFSSVSQYFLQPNGNYFFFCINSFIIGVPTIQKLVH